MDTVELRDPAEARQFVLQSLWWQRVLPVRAEQVKSILEWARLLASEGEPLPPVGFVADLGHMIFDVSATLAHENVTLAAWPTRLIRTYEDYVLGKLFADSAFERASDALRNYPSADRGK